MSRAFAPGLLVEACMTVQRRRELPLPGEIDVHIGDCVGARQRIATAKLPGELNILRVAENLGIEPEEVKLGLKKQVGHHVQTGDVLVEHIGLFGLFRSRFVSPLSGVLEFLTEKTGHLGIRDASREIELYAYMSGTVVSIEPNKAVCIEQSAAFLQGIFGVGGERFGRLYQLDVPNDHPLQLEDLPADVADCVLFGGTLPSGEFLREAARRGAQGLLTGGIDDQALREYLGYDLGIALTGDEAVSMTVIITEGFGNLPLSSRITHLLAQHIGKEVSMNGATQVRAGALRPECIIPLDAGEKMKNITQELVPKSLRLGAEVRLIRYPYFGKFGSVSALPEEAERIATGASTRVLEVLFPDGSRAKVPRANVELV